MNYFEQANEKLTREFGKVTGSKASAMKTAVRDALLRFAEQDEEFAQAIVQGGSFAGCMQAVARGVGQSISDLEAYEKATRFYFPGSRVRFEMHVDLVGDADRDDGLPQAEGGLRNDKGDGLVIDLTDFF